MKVKLRFYDRYIALYVLYMNIYNLNIDNNSLNDIL